ncbi:hypothetical protein EDM56_24300 [Brevibacillus fluminis]|uniref:SLH domain-containing protein n=1 Tax=Brevibacillus fluminis TaxID=511487 RepID=A0A3M8D1N2_9BACL|nr:hypothetical protein [Brevibacillus fluminis]RNB81990.1 hypothetical protein EDM56_24300 [Brevibacillus fluminis]
MNKLLERTGTVRKWVIVIVICALSFVGGLLASKAEEIVDIGDLSPQSDMQWAMEKGFLDSGLQEKDPITQAMFIKMLVLAYGPKENGLIVPQGAENHWAAPYYATAKKEGIIGCSCIIKPDSPLSVKEAADLVTQAVMHASEGDIGANEVAGWTGKQNQEENQINVKESAGLIRKMEETIHGTS